ncbi:12954_t:CDS:2 [Dentiscutata heterogama]|uniref:12954_t:CDS:1 n=1 Tax=Dentiscutata heterogama TaxID=1316150 RepID=A0ACA9K255_9GLOM|nr:12954_t:CDS:2 [Dentiscutata heterogama]
MTLLVAYLCIKKKLKAYIKKKEINPNKQKEVNRNNSNLRPQVRTKKSLRDISNEYTTKKLDMLEGRPTVSSNIEENLSNFS